MPLLEIHYQRNTKLTFLFSVLDATIVCSFHPFPYAPSLPLKRKKMTCNVAMCSNYGVLVFPDLFFFPPVKSYHYGTAQRDPWWAAISKKSSSILIQVSLVGISLGIHSHIWIPTCDVAPCGCKVLKYVLDTGHSRGGMDITTVEYLLPVIWEGKNSNTLQAAW